MLKGFLPAFFFLVGLHFACSQSNSNQGSPFGLDAWLDLKSQRIWRGIEVNGNHEPVFSPNLLVGIKPISFFGAYADASFIFTPFDRGEPFHTETQDQLQWRLFTEWLFFQEFFRFAIGLTLYQNINVPLTRPTATTAEIFWQIGFPKFFLSPELRVYHDLTPAQEGTFWLIDIRKSFKIFKQRVDFRGEYGVMAGFQKQGGANINDFIGIIQAIFPYEITLEATVPFQLGAGFWLAPKVAIVIDFWRYLSRDPIAAVVGLEFHFARGFEGIRLAPFQ